MAMENLIVAGLDFVRKEAPILTENVLIRGIECITILAGVSIICDKYSEFSIEGKMDDDKSVIAKGKR